MATNTIDDNTRAKIAAEIAQVNSQAIVGKQNYQPINNDGQNFADLVKLSLNNQSNNQSAKVNSNLFSSLHAKLQQNQDDNFAKSQANDKFSAKLDTKDSSTQVKTKKSDTDKSDDNDNNVQKSDDNSNDKVDAKDKSSDDNSDNKTQDSKDTASDDSQKEIKESLSTLGVEATTADVSALTSALLSLGGTKAVAQFTQLLAQVQQTVQSQDTTTNNEALNLIKAVVPALVQTGKEIIQQSKQVEAVHVNFNQNIFVATQLKTDDNHQVLNLNINQAKADIVQDSHDDVIAARIIVAGNIQRHNDANQVKIDNIAHQAQIQVGPAKETNYQQVAVKQDNKAVVQTQDVKVEAKQAVVETKAVEADNKVAQSDTKQEVKLAKNEVKQAEQKIGPKEQKAEVKVAKNEVASQVQEVKQEDTREVFIKIFGGNEVLNLLKQQIIEDAIKGNAEQNLQPKTDKKSKAEFSKFTPPDWLNKAITDDKFGDLLSSPQDTSQFEEFSKLSLNFSQLTLKDFQESIVIDAKIDNNGKIQDNGQNLLLKDNQNITAEAKPEKPHDIRSQALELLQKYQDLQSRVLTQIAAKLKEIQREGTSKIALNLHPEQLGQVNANLEFHETSVKVQLKIAQKGTYELLNNDKATLLEALHKIGYESTENDLDLSYEGQSNNNPNTNSGQDNHAQQFNQQNHQQFGDFFQANTTPINTSNSSNPQDNLSLLTKDAQLAKLLLNQIQDNFVGNVNVRV